MCLRESLDTKPNLSKIYELPELYMNAGLNLNRFNCSVVDRRHESKTHNMRVRFVSSVCYRAVKTILIRSSFLFFFSVFILKIFLFSFHVCHFI